MAEPSTNQQSNLTAADRQELIRMVDRMLDAREAARAQNQPPPQNQPPQIRAPLESDTRPLRADDIGYFNPDLQEDDAAAASGKSIIYTDVYAFTDRLKHLASIHTEARIREAFSTCIRGSALHWHSTELTDFERQCITVADITEINKLLIQRFKNTHQVHCAHYTPKHTLS
jgi:hypothetical protein